MLTLDAQVHAYERNHPVVPGVGTLAGPAEMLRSPQSGGSRHDAEDVVRCRQILIADLLGCLREFPNGRRIATYSNSDQKLCRAIFISTFLLGGAAYRMAKPASSTHTVEDRGSRASTATKI